MKMNMHDRVQRLRDNGYDLDFSKVLNEAIEYYKKTFAWGALALFLTVLLMAPLMVGGMFLIFGADIMSGADPEAVNIANLTYDRLALYMLFFVAFAAIVAPLNAGFLQTQRNTHIKKYFDLGTIFSYYASPKFGRILVLGIVVGLISTCVSTGIEMLNFPGFEIVNLLFSITFGLLTLLAIPLVIFADFGPLDALGASCSLVAKQPLLIFGLYFIAGIWGAIGIIGCCIGIFFTVPGVYSMIYAIYDNIVGFPNEPIQPEPPVYNPVQPTGPVEPSEPSERHESGSGGIDLTK